ncbi:hypothetical protein [Pseudomonas frederiksbergensis]|uniref:hypothetical protein n=1 Tax=Pseudomonas frederiksbergensis TaxID=104087 RepID=UPI003D1F1F4A
MSKQTATANIVPNGDFSQKGEHWHESSWDADVLYESGSCGLKKETLIHQTIPVAAGGGRFQFSVKMKSDQYAACRAELRLLPSSTTVLLNLHGHQPWTLKRLVFEAPADTTSVNILLMANDGEEGTRSYFDDIVVERL